MKKIIFLILILGSAVSFADQLAYITKEQAEKTIAYFNDKNIKEVVLWCACCDNNPKILVNVTNVYYKYTGYENYYQVYIAGTTPEGNVINEGVDLAYVHIKKKDKWYCLGKKLKFECDPCTKSFKL
jgi:hypothetical protein